MTRSLVGLGTGAEVGRYQPDGPNAVSERTSREESPHRHLRSDANDSQTSTRSVGQ